MNKSSSKNLIRSIIVVVLVLLAALITFVVTPKVYKLEGATANIVMLRSNIEAGTKIDETMVTTAEVGSFGLSPSTITNVNDVIGKYAVTNISSKDLLFPEKFSETAPAEAEDKNIDFSFNDNEMLVTISLSSIAAGAAGKIQPGDYVNTAVYTKASSSGISYNSFGDDAGVVKQDDVIFPENLQHLRVYRVLTPSLTPTNPTGSVTGSSNTRIPSYITLIVNKSQAEELLSYNYGNIVHFLETTN